MFQMVTDLSKIIFEWDESSSWTSLFWTQRLNLAARQKTQSEAYKPQQLKWTFELRVPFVWFLIIQIDAPF